MSSSSSSSSSNDPYKESARAVISQSLLSDKAILKCIQAKRILIEPFNMQNLGTTSYDVSLGMHYFRESEPEAGMGVYNPYSAEMVDRVWGVPQVAEKLYDWTARTLQTLQNISSEDFVIWLKPGETILGHTEEFIGGRETVTTMMKARSSMGRNFIEVCKCAGWGDIGYVNRWTMEITNNSRHYSIPLIVGRRIAQIIFFDTDGTLTRGQGSYERSGKYQKTDDMRQLKRNWKPYDMLPRMYEDREICRSSFIENISWVYPKGSGELVLRDEKEKAGLMN